MIGTARLRGAVLVVSMAAATARAEIGEDFLLADLPDEVVLAVRKAAAVDGDASPARILDRILASGSRRRFDRGFLSIETDSRWFETTGPDRAGAPLLELRRWPGDSVLAFYALSDTERDPNRLLPGASFSPRPAGTEGRIWEGRLSTSFGSRSAIWIEREVEAVPFHLGALLLPSGAGLGSRGAEAIEAEMLEWARRAEVRPERLRDGPDLPGDGLLILPEALGSPGPGDERREPWRVVKGDGFTIGLPPGILARSLGADPPAPRPMPGASLWLRGSFVDRDGNQVVVGDPFRAGYVARIGRPARSWAEGSDPPLLCPSARRVDGRPLDPLLSAWTRAKAGRVDHFEEPGWGDWLVFRLVFEAEGIELALPVARGWRSVALFWIPFTWRPAGERPAPPPIDPAERFGIRFLPLPPSDRRRNVFDEGTLELPGVRMVVPRGWWPVASLQSSDGFPVRLEGPGGEAAVRITRLAAGSAELANPEERGWTRLRRAQRAAGVYRRGDRFLFVARQGHGYLLEVEPIEPRTVSILERVADSVELAGR
jgi:hypothetical protein